MTTPPKGGRKADRAARDAVRERVDVLEADVLDLFLFVLRLARADREARDPAGRAR